VKLSFKNLYILKEDLNKMMLHISENSLNHYNRKHWITRSGNMGDHRGKQEDITSFPDGLSTENLYFGILGWIFINTFNIFPSPPLNEQTWLARQVSI
jgi:hypothetical protein